MPEGETIRLKTILSERDEKYSEAVRLILERKSAPTLRSGKNRRERERLRELRRRFMTDSVSRGDAEEIMTLLLAEISRRNTTEEYYSEDYSSVRGAYIVIAGLVSELMHRKSGE